MTIYEIFVYETEDGKVPLDKWLDSLDTHDKYRISVRIRRLKFGNFSHCKPVDGGVCEIVITRLQGLL